MGSQEDILPLLSTFVHDADTTAESGIISLTVLDHTLVENDEPEHTNIAERNIDNSIVDNAQENTKNIQTEKIQVVAPIVQENTENIQIATPIVSPHVTSSPADLIHSQPAVTGLRKTRRTTRPPIWIKVYVMPKKTKCNSTHWKSKFIDGLPTLFAERVRKSLRGDDHSINYDDYTYGKLISACVQEGLSLCNEIKLNQQIKRHRLTERKQLGEFCEQFAFDIPKQKSKDVESSSHKKKKSSKKDYEKWKQKKIEKKLRRAEEGKGDS
ncbi:hypothetical protein H5410_016371 [Solanum commersonii]|uniref:Uncharacterized protein n=1 Tax=Solanum commersonii TaxID=4109 RepID=A0A9J5ZWU8_SOLCO|nr:hypothetical protein H5410_016371 [Solanum commersonii]